MACIGSLPLVGESVGLLDAQRKHEGGLGTFPPPRVPLEVDVWVDDADALLRPRRASVPPPSEKSQAMPRIVPRRFGAA